MNEHEFRSRLAGEIACRERLEVDYRKLLARLRYYEDTVAVDGGPLAALRLGGEALEVRAIDPERLEDILEERRILRRELVVLQRLEAAVRSRAEHPDKKGDGVRWCAATIGAIDAMQQKEEAGV